MPLQPLAFLLVFLGGGLGASLRHLTSQIMGRAMGENFPWGTFTCNILGGFLMGAFIGYMISGGEGAQAHNLRLLVATGMLGGFTTFSSFTLEAYTLYERHAYTLAAAYVLGSVMLAMAGLVAGLALSRHLWG